MMNMNRRDSMIKNSIRLTVALVFAMVISGCSALQETMQAQMEVPTLEKQANRVAIGMTIVRENNIMARRMPISSDAKWPKKVSAELSDEERLAIKKILFDDPYFSTVNYTEPIQRQKLGSGMLMNQLGGYGQIAAAVLNQNVTPLMYRAFEKIRIFYGDNPENWPNIFNFDATKGNFNEFKNGTLVEIEAIEGDSYPTISDAIIALAPVNTQKDLEMAKENMLESYGDVLDKKSEIADIETQLKTDEARKSAKNKNVKIKELDGVNDDYTFLSEDEIKSLEEQKDVLEEEVKEKESIADEKEKIYFELLDQASIALQSDINLDDKEYVSLAQNVNLVANEIQASSTEAYTTFGLAATSIAVNGIIQNFPTELQTLAIAKASVPMNLQDKYNERIKRLVQNTVYLLPNMVMGTYYAHKQAVLAEKYADFTDIILEAYNVKLEQSAAKNAPTKEQVDDASEEIKKESQEQ